MEVREASASYLRTTGYKQTEVGLIPEDWSVKLLPDVCRFRGGKAHEQHISDFGQFVCVNSKFISMDGKVRKYSTANFCSAKRGDILMVMSDLPNGKALAKAYVVDQDNLYAVNQRVCALTPYRDDSKYLFYVLNRNPYFLKFDDGVNQTHLLNPVFKKCSLPLPPTKTEQEAIAESLSDADALIESLEQLLAKKRYLKQGAMQELLTGKKRLLEFSGEWGTVCLRDLLTYERPDRYIVQDTKYIERGQIPVLTANKSFILGYTDEDFGICRDIPVIVFDDFTTDSKYVEFPFKVKSSAIKLLRPKHDRMDLRYVFERMQLIRFPLGGHKRYYISEFQNLELETPDYDEQQAIAAILSNMDAEIAALEAKLAKARNLKQGMMQELLTGRIRLVQPSSNVVRLPVKKKTDPTSTKSHNWQINEAVVISVLAKHFGSEQWPLGRKRYTKLSYLLHRQVERQVEGYLKKAAGPYNPETKYKGPEGIALKNRYVRFHSRDKFSGIVAAEKIGEAEGYFSRWYGKDVLAWLEQFRRKSNDELELLATVDMAMNDLCRGGKAAELATVKKVIQGHPEWEAKLDRAIFSDDNIRRAIESCRQLFAFEEADG